MGRIRANNSQCEKFEVWILRFNSAHILQASDILHLFHTLLLGDWWALIFQNHDGLKFEPFSQIFHALSLFYKYFYVWFCFHSTLLWRGQLTFPGQASLAIYQYLVHILSPVTGRERMSVEIISWPISKKECCEDRTRDRLHTRRIKMFLRSHMDTALYFQ